MSGLLIVRLDTAGGENWRECADMLYAARPLALPEARLLTGLTLERYPGCGLVCVPGEDGGWILGTRSGLTVVTPPAGPSGVVRPVR
ncbi:hypothetical protein [Streptomyces acidiscabies]|uniref:Uncharacterized protein n=1 Tax=Streptomyces acidiscabies TaxID=42234 RepID=A0AAP6B8Q5_9ACTN|nr:hypothetical protein [Streptomyces acidiscabies]MBP5936211.1 hypothetical protein [Streptomyces sp. LBUM 1476]MBZ3915847.1 hypothetical protein [Streptomyces acidiscabies]MDX2960254.1 hypothetical protein [Streptomyces acidiscabies]MDX3019605.1 hypothetical protein [Streptomyces acidiscabies]MDX3793294.1 hypothetical protein [Streptomyces acidiscabies]